MIYGYFYMILSIAYKAFLTSEESSMDDCFLIKCDDLKSIPNILSFTSHVIG